MDGESRDLSWKEAVCEAAGAIIRRTKATRGIGGTPTYGEVMHAVGYFHASLEMELEKLPKERRVQPKLRVLKGTDRDG